MVERAFRKRNTPDNLKLLKELEKKFDEIRTTAQENWSENLCRKINEAKSMKERQQQGKISN
jgi:prephenate dehydrogenase